MKRWKNKAYCPILSIYNVSPKETWEILQRSIREKKVTRKVIYEQHILYKEGRNYTRSGLPSVATTPIDKLKEPVEEDRRIRGGEAC